MSNLALDALLAPRSIAVVGASNDPARIGGRPLQQLRAFGFRGPVYGVNPRHTEVQSYPCVASLADLPERPDAVILAVNAEVSLDVIEQCGAMGVKAAVLFSAGFAELGTEEGKARQARLCAIAAQTGMAVAGPNCTGVANLRTGAMLSFLNLQPPSQADMRPHVAVVSQSGALGHAIVVAGGQAGLGFSHVLNTGNEACLELVDYLEYLADDADCTTVLAYVEQVRSGARFMAAARELRRRGKLLAVLKVGRSAKGAEAAQSHTAALAGNDQAYRAAFRASGVAEAADIAELVDIAVLHRTGVRPRPGVGVLSVSGAAGVALADGFADVGLPLPTLESSVQARLRNYIPTYGIVTNPVDITANAVNDSSTLPELLSIIGAAPNVGTVVIFVSGRMLARSLNDVSLLMQDGLSGTLIVHVDMLASGNGPEISAAGIASFTDMSRAVRAVTRYTAWCAAEVATQSGQGADPATSAALTAALTSIVETARSAGRHTLAEVEAKKLLRIWGMNCIPDVVVVSPQEAADAFERLSGTAVLKLSSPDVTHKTEVGGVLLGIGSGSEAAEAYEAIVSNAARLAPGASIAGVLVQPHVKGGVELLLGARRDPVFGWLLTVGSGGIWTEVLGDVASALAPVSLEAAQRMVRSLRSFPLLDGHRGAPRADVAAACREICVFSQLLPLLTVVTEVEINPLLVMQTGIGAVVGDALMILAA